MKRPPVSFATAQKASAMGLGEQFAFYLFCGVALPAVMWSATRGTSLLEPLAQRTAIELALANAATCYILTRLRTYARARLLSYVLPVNLAVFGTVAALNSLVRLNVSITLFLACFAATIAISFLVTMRIRHVNPRLLHYIVPGGDSGKLSGRQGFVDAPSISKMRDLVEGNQVSGSIIADLHHEHPPEWERLLARAALKGIPVYHYRLLEEALTGEVRINHLRENELGSLIPNLPYRTAKRAFDIALVVLVAPLLLPALALLALAIRIESNGPAIFIQERIGFRGETFRMFKFRTMAVQQDTGDPAAQLDQKITKDNDARITRIGRYLRKTRMDELPQAWNILMGDMSWIGPRPEARELADWYEAEIPFYSYRHIVRPGITGWAQVNQGHVADLDSVKAKLRFDFYYVKNLSLWLDILIALKTLRVVVQGIGAK
ncbi:MAG: exopolysaccharide biosynthesis polyprenyl glycosylphosphotransferase [Alphaproteobacteria bacterium]|nr:MAG: exopolysaccharide biosynthesis polyprenyl glycosylphosphotransferase [Alphaproteobacteria bacterium]